MGHSEHDPGAKDLRPWNAGRKIGAKRALKPQHISTRQYARLVDEWVTGIGLRREDSGTHSLRLTKASIIDKQTGNLRAVQILLSHTKIESTVRYLGVAVEDALALAEATEV
jgi:site-specific recombinase XerD